MVVEAVAFGAESGAMIQERSGPVGEFGQRDLSCRYIVGGVGDGLACGASVESVAARGIAHCLTVTGSCCFEIVGDVSDRSVVGGAELRQLGQALIEFFDALLDACVLLLFGFDGGSCVGEGAAGVVSEGLEPVRDRASRPQLRSGRNGLGKVAACACGGEVGSVGCEDVLEGVDGVDDVVGVGDDADEVLVASAGDGDVEPSAGGGWGGEGDGAGGGV